MAAHGVPRRPRAAPLLVAQVVVTLAMVASGLTGFHKPSAALVVAGHAESAGPGAAEGGLGWMETLTSNVYYASFLPLMALTAAMAWMTRPRAGKETVVPGFRDFQYRYLFVWALAIGADWLQGPYVYALYASYGFSGGEIAQLFVAGFLASMLFGTVVGALADAWGRKCCAVIYCVCYICSCVTKHSNLYHVLLLGRILGGVATSLLFSTFECWMVAEHRRRGFSEALLRHMFGLMFFVQYLAAIAAGLVAQVAANAHPLSKIGEGFGSLHFGGYTAPFDLAICLLLVAVPAILLTWTENYGDSAAGQTSGLSDSFAAAGRALVSGWRVPLLGVIVTAFEGCMFAFVFNWTPALSSGDSDAPHGLIFSMFMMACMCGSSLFSIVSATTRPSSVLLPVCLVATLSLGLVTACLGDEPKTGAIFLGFLIFEACVGIYFPAIGSLKSEVVPEDARAGVYNAYRVPLNAVVVVLLLTDLSLRASFGVCCSLLLLAVAAARVVLRA